MNNPKVCNIALYFHQYGPIDTFKRMAKLLEHRFPPTDICFEPQQLYKDFGGEDDAEVKLIPCVTFEFKDCTAGDIELMRKLGLGLLDGIYMDVAVLVYDRKDGNDNAIYICKEGLEHIVPLDRELNVVVFAERMLTQHGESLFVTQAADLVKINEADGIMMEVAGCHLDDITCDMEPYDNNGTFNREEDPDK